MYNFLIIDTDMALIDESLSIIRKKLDNSVCEALLKLITRW